MNILDEVAKHIANGLIEDDDFDLRDEMGGYGFWVRCDYKQRLSLACRETGLAAGIQNKVEKLVIEHLGTGDLPKYQQLFGANYDIGIKLPDGWRDISYKNDASPSFVLHLPENKYLKLWAGCEEIQHHTRYAFCECSGPDQDYEHIRLLLETNDSKSVQHAMDSWQCIELLMKSTGAKQ